MNFFGAAGGYAAPVGSEQPSPEQVDADPDLVRDPHQGAVLAAVSLGGIIGAEARYGLGLLVKDGPSGLPTATLVINVVGSLLLGVLMAVAAVRTVPVLTRPFLGIGVLGGFTTFSTLTVGVVGLVHHHHVVTAVLYLASTVAACALAVWAGDRLARAALRR